MDYLIEHFDRVAQALEQLETYGLDELYAELDREMDKDAGLVAFEHRCPYCGERDTDELFVTPDETIECNTCGTTYRL